MRDVCSYRTWRFKALFVRLPAYIQRQADKQYELWRANPRHPSLQFKSVGRFYSARINDDFRALTRYSQDDECWIGFWIGTHSAYDKLVAR